jgi:acyl carrier protein
VRVADFLNLVCQSLKRLPNTLSMTDTPATVEEWDSIGHLSIIAAIDGNLPVSVNDDELRNFTSIEQLVKRLKARGVLEE